MEVIWEFIKFIGLSLLIVAISKYLLVPVLRKLAESLKLGPKAVGNITGIATSVPELLTVSFSAIAGFMGTSIYNIISSNIINVIQYMAAMLLNKNQKIILKNTALKIDLLLVGITIIIPIVMVILNISMNWITVGVFVIGLVIFYWINLRVHQWYLKKEEEKLLQEEIEKEKKEKKGKSIIIYIILLVLISIALYLVGNYLSDVLSNLNTFFHIPEFVLGIALGFITSLPELITFFESQKHHKETNVELGVVEATNNLLTSNILNLFAIQSIGIILFTIFS